MDERRTAWLLVFVVAAQLLLLALQAPSRSAGDNFLEGLVLRLVAPIPRGVSAVSARAARFLEGLRRQSEIIHRNRDLRREIEQLEIEVTRLRQVESDLAALSLALQYERPPGLELSVADVVFLDRSNWLRSLILYVGETPVEINQAVITSAGLLGRIVQVAPPYAKVQLITDQTAAVGAMIERTRRQGVVRSGASGLELDFLPLRADIQEGDQVLTSGIDGVFPRGIPIGTVSDVSPGDDLFYRIRLSAAVDPDRLDQVYLLAPSPLPEEILEEGSSAP
ncbi:MAG: rod shape-determining protein MreC [Acidobacteriota bacterium]